MDCLCEDQVALVGQRRLNKPVGNTEILKAVWNYGIRHLDNYGFVDVELLRIMVESHLLLPSERAG